MSMLVVGVVVGLGEEAHVDLEVEGLDEAALHLGLAGVVGDGLEAVFLAGLEEGLDGGVGAAGREDDELGARLEEGGDKGVEPGLVGDGDEGAADGDAVVDVLDDVEHGGLLSVRAVRR